MKTTREKKKKHSFHPMDTCDSRKFRREIDSLHREASPGRCCSASRAVGRGLRLDGLEVPQEPLGLQAGGVRLVPGEPSFSRASLSRGERRRKKKKKARDFDFLFFKETLRLQIGEFLTSKKRRTDPRKSEPALEEEEKDADKSEEIGSSDLREKRIS